MYMNTDEINEELAVMQLSDSFFPTGLYATSNGLEFLFSKSIREIINFSKLLLSKLDSLKIFPKIKLMFIIFTFKF